jgi:hypothetical protein
MPELKVSEQLQTKQSFTKHILHGLSGLSLTTDTCPKCGVSGFRDGICPNAACQFLDPRLEAAYEAYAQATMVQQQAMQDSNKTGGKYNSRIALQQTPAVIIDQFPQSSEKIAPEKCNRCNEMTLVDGSCKTQGCIGEKPPAEFRTPQVRGTGIDVEALGIDPENIPMNIPQSLIVQFIRKRNERKERKNNKQNKGKPSKARRKTTATINRIAAAEQQPNIDPGMFLSSGMTVSKDPTTRIHDMELTNAQMQTQKKLDSAMGGSDESKTDNNTSEELK